MDIYARSIICTTKRTKTEKFKGGVSNYQKIRNELLILCKRHKNEKITTMFDYYGMPDNTPEINISGDLYERVSRIMPQLLSCKKLKMNFLRRNI